jgi:dsRNA-specific ribonuclease
MSRLNSLHNKTQVVPDEELPYNPKNRLITGAELQLLLSRHGLSSIQPRNINVYRNAFVHRSYCTMKNDDFQSGNEKCPDGCLPLQEMSYERLEFLGDAILGMVVARYLYERYPDQNEGFLSRIRTKIVNGRMLGSLAEKVGFPPFAILSKQIEESQGRNNYKIMEDIFEAFIGALYMDFNDDLSAPCGFPPLSGIGYYVAEQWIVSIIETYLDFSELICTKTNYKDMLVRYMQHTFQMAPQFYEMAVETRQNQKWFKYSVKDRHGVVLGAALGSSKKDAENNAARVALEYYGQSV